MKFIYILNEEREIIDIAKINSDRFKLLERITFNRNILTKSQDNNLVKISFIEINKIENLIEQLIKERPFDFPTYEGRFKEDEIFKPINYKNQNYKLCNTGYDNQIIFMINIYNAVLNNKGELFIFFANTHNDFDTWKKSYYK